jgi:DNA-damage-inducible protein J
MLKRITFMANVNIRVEDTLKTQTEQIFSELGLSMSAATNAFYRQVVRFGGIPFELRVTDPFYSEKNQAHLRAAKERMERTGGTVHDLIEVDDVQIMGR